MEANFDCNCIVWGGQSQAGKYLFGWARDTGRLAPGAPLLASAGAPRARGSLSAAQLESWALLELKQELQLAEHPPPLGL